MQKTKILEIVTIQALELQIKKIFSNANVKTSKPKTTVINASKINKTRTTVTNPHKTVKDYECLKQNVESINRNIYSKF